MFLTQSLTGMHIIRRVWLGESLVPKVSYLLPSHANDDSFPTRRLVFGPYRWMNYVWKLKSFQLHTVFLSPDNYNNWQLRILYDCLICCCPIFFLGICLASFAGAFLFWWRAEGHFGKNFLSFDKKVKKEIWKWETHCNAPSRCRLGSKYIKHFTEILFNN